MDRAEERAGPEDVGDQALMRGLDTAFPFVRPGLSLSGVGRRSCDRPRSKAREFPLPWSRPRCCTIDVRWCSAVISLLLRVKAEGLWAGRALHSSSGP